MLEKIGLPAKPSMRGANWVIDASHCQGCSSQFSFFNRKHHCRRCGGIFCNSCTQQRMILRGQGVSPVRICDPCKKLEEATRFELRYGHKIRAAKGNAKQIPNTEDELRGEILHTDENHSKPSGKEAYVLPHPETGSSVFHANSCVVLDSGNFTDGHNDTIIELATTPEDLRQKAIEEKKIYRMLKAEGKTEEALKVFKHAKDLERQAGALQIAMRKNHRMSGKVLNINDRFSKDRIDNQEALGCDKKLSSRDKEVNDELFSELRQLGWSDTELQNEVKKTVKPSLENELSSLLGETPEKTEICRKKGGIDKTQVVAHKRKALLLKREGKLAEAKEELKQAKILERQLEEQEFLGDASDFDDELSTLINNMDGDDNQVDLMLKNTLDTSANFDYLLGAIDDLPIDISLEVTDNDMNDPELGAALKSFGWVEEDDEAKVFDLEGHSQKQLGNLPEVMTLIKKVNLPKSKMVIQKELLALKKKALTLRREGRLEEADEELKKGRILEQQLDELENAFGKTATTSSSKNMLPTHSQYVDPKPSLDLEEDGCETDVTDQDMHDPAMLSALKNLGWNEDGSDSLSITNSVSEPSKSYSMQGTVFSAMPWKLIQNKGEIQRELLAIKRKALSLRRQGKIEAAEEELVRAKDLEKQLVDLEASQSSVPLIKQDKHDNRDAEDNSSVILDVERHISPHTKTNKIVDTANPSSLLSNSKFADPKMMSELGQFVGDSGKQNASVGETVSHKLKDSSNTSNKINGYKDDIHAHKRNALTLKREGKLMEAKEELRKAKLLEKSLEEGQESNISDKTTPASTYGSTSILEEDCRTHVSKSNSSRDRFKLQHESLVHKRNALKLRREGKIQEADVEFEKAKELENQFNELGVPGSSGNTVIDTGGMEDLLDPQLMSALKSIGWDSKDLLTKIPDKLESQSTIEKISSHQSPIDIHHIEEQIKAGKIRALNLKRAGKHDEALEALRSARKLEKELTSLS